MEMIGFTFIATQEEFEQWQIDNPDYSVRTVSPHMLEIGIEGSEKYSPSVRGQTKWGVFVAYMYSLAPPN